MLEQALTALGYELAPSNGVLAFVLLTLLVGGGAAWRTGQAVAEGWEPPWPAAAYTVLIAEAVRFLHYALFQGNLISLPSFLVDLAILLASALLAYRLRRTRLMTEQYPWLFVRAGPLTWRNRS